VEADLENDWLCVRYNAGKVTPQDMLRTVAGQQFEGKIVAGAPPPR
jgi:hypothetical protein